MATARAHPQLSTDAPKASILRATPSALRALRPGVSLSTLARRTLIAKPHLSRILSGKRKLTVANAWRIAAALGVSIERVLHAISPAR